ncbi:MAG: universal stress protein, partial [Dehalococcoidia bacterium]|nr:universal stress protein [Dehalococcoidia bacterium]
VVRAKQKPTPANQVRLDVVILPLDGSRLAEQAIPHATALAGAMSMKLKLVRVTPFAQDLYMYTDYPIGAYAEGYEEAMKSLDTEAVKYLSNVSKRLQKQGVSSVEQTLLRGNPADAIVDIAQKTEDNLVVMTTHGRSGVGRFLMGSVADRVVRYCGDPALIIRATGAAKGAKKGAR